MQSLGFRSPGKLGYPDYLLTPEVFRPIRTIMTNPI